MRAILHGYPGKVVVYTLHLEVLLYISWNITMLEDMGRASLNNTKVLDEKL